MIRWRWLIVLGLIAAALGVAWYARLQLVRERLARYNAEAAADSSRLVYSDSVRRVSERLAYQQSEAIRLEGDLAKVLRQRHEQTQAMLRLTVQLDSVANVVREGQVTAVDSAIRHLAAQLDTAGFRVGVSADVPPPPAVARVRWSVARDPVEVVAALNRDPDGRVALRAMASGSATVRIDTVRVRLERNVSRTQRMAIPLGAVLLGYVLGRVL